MNNPLGHSMTHDEAAVYEYCAEEISTSGIISARTANLSASISFPLYVGYWQHGNTTFAMTKKPRWLTRIMMRLVFETTWKDNTEMHL